MVGRESTGAAQLGMTGWYWWSAISAIIPSPSGSNCCLVPGRPPRKPSRSSGVCRTPGRSPPPIRSLWWLITSCPERTVPATPRQRRSHSCPGNTADALAGVVRPPPCPVFQKHEISLQPGWGDPLVRHGNIVIPSAGTCLQILDTSFEMCCYPARAPKRESPYSPGVGRGHDCKKLQDAELAHRTGRNRNRLPHSRMPKNPPATAIRAGFKKIGGSGKMHFQSQPP